MSDNDVPDDVADDADASAVPARNEAKAVPLSKADSSSARAVPAASAGDDLADLDEADDSDEATLDSGDRQPVTVGATTAGSARAAARRAAAVRAGVTERKGAATRTRDSDRVDRGNLWQRLMRFLREVVSELRKVIWPARNQMVTYTIVVIVFVVIMVALVAGLDLAFAKGIFAVFG